MHKLNPVESLRAQLLLENALKKLQFLSYLGNSGSSNSNNNSNSGSEQLGGLGDEISRTISDQRQLEKRYEQLIKERSELKGLLNKKAYERVQLEIGEVAQKLRESNKALCRNLKENPNAQGNLIKMQQERTRIQSLLEDTKSELLELGFSNLVSRVESERRDQELLSEVKKKEREASNTVKCLEKELHAEYIDHERDMKNAMTEIKNLKEELQRNKTESSILLATEEKKLKAQESALQRALQQKELALSQELQNLIKQKNRETTAHERVHDFLAKKLEDLAEERQMWTTKYDTGYQSQQDKLQKIREDSAQIRQKLVSLRDRESIANNRRSQIEKESTSNIETERFRLGQQEKMNEAVLYLQSEGRHYMNRLAIKAARGKGKKGKKGKKK